MAYDCITRDAGIKNYILEAGKPKRERDEIFVGKWDEQTHLDYAKNAKKSVVTREPIAKGAKTAKPVKEVPKTPVDEQEMLHDRSIYTAQKRFPECCPTFLGHYVQYSP